MLIRIRLIQQRLRLACSIEPLHGKQSTAHSAAVVNQRSALGEIELRRTVHCVVSDLLQHWSRRPAHLQSVQVERYSKQGTSVHVNQMATGQIAPERATSHERFPAMVFKRNDFDVGSVVSNRHCASREQDSLTSRQNLWPPVGDLSVQ